MTGTHTKRIGAIAAIFAGIELAGCAPAGSQTASISGSFVCLWDCGNAYISNTPSNDGITLIASVIVLLATIIAVSTTKTR